MRINRRMKRKVFAGVLVLFAALWCACGHSSNKKDASIPAEDLYRSAMELYAKKSWPYAYEDFERVRTRYPVSEYGIKAQLKMADCLYYQKQYTGALTQYEEFGRLHPSYEYIDYVYYQMGMCYFKQLCTFDRDQTFAMESIKQFGRLVSLFPNSPYVYSALEKIDISKKILAAHWVYIGDFYYRTGCYISARDRYQEALQDYFSHLTSPDHVYYQLGKTYLRLDKPEHARQQFAKIVQDYSDGSYASKAQELLEDPEDIKELDEMTFDEIVDGLNPFYECEGPVDPDEETCKPKE